MKFVGNAGFRLCYGLFVQCIVCQKPLFAKPSNIRVAIRDHFIMQPIRLRFSILRVQQMLFAVLLLSWHVFLAHPSLGQDPVDFAHDILPTLKNRCAKCHSNGVFKGGLSLETRDQLIESAVVESGKHASSNLFDRITSDDPDEQMPPEGDRLTEAEIKKFAAWIDGGLVWPAELTLKNQHFARPLQLRLAELPSSPSGLKHPIDRLIVGYFERESI